MSGVYPYTLKKLIETFSLLPGLGEKSATRLSMFLLSKPELCETLGDLIKELPYKVKLCKFCRNLSEEETCSICKDENREPELLCIVENPVNLSYIEETRVFKGYYFVLHYLLSPKDGIGPKELGLDHLLFLIKLRNIKEIIIALSPTLAGEATTSYILEVLKNYPVKVTKIACGIPMGMEIQFVDPLTLKKALFGREILKEK
ncbi:MAG: recombination protein RecR [Thermodesulfobacteriota bacterium]|nr:MAG: recombination protein RecR [Thermodesulfobacteriota bacterium]